MEAGFKGIDQGWGQQKVGIGGVDHITNCKGFMGVGAPAKSSAERKKWNSCTLNAYSEIC